MKVKQKTVVEALDLLISVSYVVLGIGLLMGVFFIINSHDYGIVAYLYTIVSIIVSAIPFAVIRAAALVAKYYLQKDAPEKTEEE